MTSPRNRLEPAVAGTWYPADATALREQVTGLLEARDPKSPAKTPARAVIAPHAGYAYSGAVAGSAFAHLEGQTPGTVVLIGPSHYEAHDGAFVPRAATYRTPLGDVELDRRLLDRITDGSCIVASDRPFLPEHSLEAELPFLQQALGGGWRGVPILTGAGLSRAALDRLVAALTDEMPGDALIVVSSDFTHYGRRFGYVPFTEDVPASIRRLDLGAVEHITAGDPDGFRDYCRRTGATICGRDAIEVLLRVRPAEVSASLSAYDCSGHMTGTWDLSVSYAGLVFAPVVPNRADA